MIDITFVPLWLERHLKSLGHPITVVNQPTELANILSSRDVQNYEHSVMYFEHAYLVHQGFVPQCNERMDWIHGMSPDEVTKHLYGNTYLGADYPVHPGFHVNVIGDGIYVRVDPTRTSDAMRQTDPSLVTDLISAVVNYMPLNLVAGTALFRNYVTVAASAK